MCARVREPPLWRHLVAAVHVPVEAVVAALFEVVQYVCRVRKWRRAGSTGTRRGRR